MDNVKIDVSDVAVQEADWQDWLRRWEAQQSSLIPAREARFGVMLDVLEVLLPPNFVALDLCSGPGSISHRLLARFPQARTVAVDLDPLLLAIGEGALGTVEGRLRWVEADLRQAEWVEKLDETQFDAVLTTTALHWLPTPDLARVYYQLGQLVRTGGVVLNGDSIKFGPHLPSFQKIVETMRARNQEISAATPVAENWQQWWDAARQEPALQEITAERDRRFAWRSPSNWCNPIYDFQVAALREAGFVEVDTIWQRFGNRVLMAVR